MAYEKVGTMADGRKFNFVTGELIENTPAQINKKI